MRSSSVVRTHRRLLRRGVAAVFAGSLAVGLTACTPADRVAVRIIDGEMTFVVCDRVTVEEIVVLVSDESNQGGDLITYWDASGDGVFGSSDKITYGAAPDGFETSVGPTPLPHDDERIAFDAVQRGGRSSVEGVYVASEISDDYWLQMGGDHTDESCA